MTPRQHPAEIPSAQNPRYDDAAWAELVEAAHAARERAYVPYSGYPVGAAARTEDGRIVSGANIENASLGITLCAECSLVSDLFRTGGGKLRAFVCVDEKGEILMPCGRCRQLLHEHRAPGMEILSTRGVLGMDQILPLAFGPEDFGPSDFGPGDFGEQAAGSQAQGPAGPNPGQDEHRTTEGEHS